MWCSWHHRRNLLNLSNNFYLCIAKYFQNLMQYRYLSFSVISCKLNNYQTCTILTYFHYERQLLIISEDGKKCTRVLEGHLYLLAKRENQRFIRLHRKNWGLILFVYMCIPCTQYNYGNTYRIYIFFFFLHLFTY